MNECTYKKVIRGRVVSYLKDYQLPVRKKLKTNIKGYNHVAKRSVFHEKIETDRLVPIPKIFDDLCNIISEHVTTEGIFWETGSKSRQDILKRKIFRKELWQSENVDVIDAAALLKYYMAVLPVPLIPPIYYELLFACLNLDNKEELLIVAILLLPIENLNLLSYLMIFFHKVPLLNKMNSHNLAVCIAPSVIPIRAFSPEIPVKAAEIVAIFVENATRIGIIPDYIQMRLNVSERCIERKKKVYKIWIYFKRKLC